MKEKLLTILEKNSKISLQEIADEMNVSLSNVCSVITELERERVICGYNTIINWDKITRQKVTALIEVKVIPQRGTGFDSIANRIKDFNEVDDVYLLSGNYDFMLVINGKSMREISSFVFDKLSTIDKVQSTATHFVLKKYKDHGIILDEEKDDKREKVIL